VFACFLVDSESVQSGNKSFKKKKKKLFIGGTSRLFRSLTMSLEPQETAASISNTNASAQVASPTSSSSGSTSAVVLESWLSIRDVSKLWQRFYFVLTSKAHLEYYDDIKKATKMGEIDLEGSSVDAEPAARSFKSHCFEILQGDQEFLLSAPTEILKIEWLQTLTKVAKTKSRASQEQQQQQQQQPLPTSSQSSTKANVRASSQFVDFQSVDMKSKWTFNVGSVTKVSDCLKQIGLQSNHEMSELTMLACNITTKQGKSRNGSGR
jgi:hypothetical protein